MAQRTTVEVLDDTNGQPGASPVRFGLDGQEYEIDLTEENAEELRASLQPFLAVARKFAQSGRGRGRSERRSGGGGGSGRDRSSAIREWARGKGLEVSERGRLPRGVVEAWEAEHGSAGEQSGQTEAA